MSGDTVTLTLEEARALVARALSANNVADDNAAIVAEALVAAEVDGQAGHGLSRVASYAAQAASGKVDGHADVQISQPAQALLHVDAGGGFAFPALRAAITRLAPLARETGIAAAYVYRSHHCGQLGAHVEALAGQGCVALMVANSPPAMAPWGGATPIFGTNPIAFAAPRTDAPPLVIDLSLSKVARGKVMAAAKTGQDIPEGWALDATGAPTTDPKAALGGAMLPMGDAKGAALALIIEILCATLTGANHSYDASSFFDAEGPAPGVGQTLIAFHPDAAMSGFASRIEALLSRMTEQPGTRLPGAARAGKRQYAKTEGVTVKSVILKEIQKLAGHS